MVNLLTTINHLQKQYRSILFCGNEFIERFNIAYIVITNTLYDFVGRRLTIDGLDILTKSAGRFVELLTTILSDVTQFLPT